LSLRETIESDLKTALKAGEKIALGSLRMVKSEVRKREVAKSADTVLGDGGIIEVISSLVKKGKESIRYFEEGGRQELADKEKAEIKVLEKYLPAQISEDEIREIVKGVVEKLGITDMKGMGQVMKGAMAEVGKSADGNIVSGIVKEILSGKG
jgi:uncharacterized protein YqeY